jgi:hypothetical protein
MKITAIAQWLLLHPSRKHPPAKVRAFVDFCVGIATDL